MTQPEDFTAAQASDPQTPGQILADIAALRPDLRVAVAGNPSAYPGLLEWLGSLGDPAVDVAIAARPPAAQVTQQLPSSPPTGPLDAPEQQAPQWAPQPSQGPGYAQPPQGPYAQLPQGPGYAQPSQGPGYALPPPGAPGTFGAPAPTSNKALWIVLGIIGGVVVLVGVVIFIFVVINVSRDAADDTVDDIDDYGDNAALDRLWDACEDEDWQACDDLYLNSPVDSQYEEFGDTCGGRSSGSTWCTSEFGGDATASAYGDDPDLDGLWDSCTAQDWVACDDLYIRSGVGTAYEAYGSSCGNRTDTTDGGCAIEYGAATFTYGDDVYLDGLWDACEGGDMAACDDLYLGSPVDSEYEEFGDTCGGRTDGVTWCVP